jgi:hypothetical protein
VSVLLPVPDRFVEKIKTHFMFDNFFPENLTVYEMMWKNIEESDGPHVDIIWSMRIACWITRATNTLSQYMLLFHYKNVYKNAPHFYFLRTLLALLHFFPMSPLSRSELTSLHRLNPSGFGAANHRVLLFRPTENRNGQPFVSDVVLCSWTL